MTGRLLVAFAIVLATSRGAWAQSAAPPSDFQLQAAPPMTLEPATPQAVPPAAPDRARPRSLIQAEINELAAQRREYGLGLPIGLMVAGGLVTINGVVFLLLGLLMDSVDTCSNTFDDDPFADDDCATDDLAQAYIIGGGVAAGVGVVLLIVGGTLLGKRTGPRRELGERIKALQQELTWSVAGLPLSVEPLASGAALRLSF